MPRSPQEQAAWELQAYGMPAQDVLDAYDNEWFSRGISLLGMLSDCQEIGERMVQEYHRGQAHLDTLKDRQRRTLNCAKMLLEQRVLPKDEEGRLL